MGNRFFNDKLTDDSGEPAAELYNNNTDGRKFMGKPITSIRNKDDGNVSFAFMGGNKENIISNVTNTGIGHVTVDGVVSTKAFTQSTDAISATALHHSRKGHLYR